jgi:hypothetical protein
MELPNLLHKMARIHQEPLQKGYHLVPHNLAQASWIDGLSGGPSCGRWRCLCIQISEIIEQETMDKAISPTDPPQSMSGSIIEEGQRLPGKGVSAREPEAQDVVLHSTLQPHLFATERRQERRRLSWI